MNADHERILVIANVGQRDLYLDGNLINKNGEGLRAEAETISKDYKNLSNKLSAPMITAALEHIHRVEPKLSLEAVWLCATNQQDEHFRKQDTKPAASVITHILNASKLKIILKNSPMIKEIKQAPNDYNTMLGWYNSIVPDKESSDFDKLYVICTGGTPACNTSLLLAGIQKYREKCVALYINEKDSNVKQIRVGDEVLRGQRQEALERLLERFDFDALARAEGYSEDICQLAMAVSARMNFDFDACYCHLNKLREHINTSYVTRVDELIFEVQRLCDGIQEAILEELYWNALIKWQRNEGTDFLGRIWRIMEQVQHSLIKQLIPDLDTSHFDRATKKLQEWVRNQPGLEEALRNKKNDLKILFNTEVIGLILKYCKENNWKGFPESKHTALTNTLLVFDFLDPCRNMRNKSIIAHGYQGISCEGILDALKCDEETFLQKLKDLIEVETQISDVNPYHVYSKLIRKWF